MTDKAKRKAADPEIEIMPEMIRAGLDEYYAGDTKFESAEAIVERIFRRMLAMAIKGGALSEGGAAELGR